MHVVQGKNGTLFSYAMQRLLRHVMSDADAELHRA